MSLMVLTRMVVVGVGVVAKAFSTGRAAVLVIIALPHSPPVTVPAPQPSSRSRRHTPHWPPPSLLPCFYWQSYRASERGEE